MKKRNKSKSTRRRGWPMVLACIAVLACGFFFAARQHFSSMDFGMKNSRLRKQIDDLESEKRRLMLAREVSLSPAEIKKAAAKAKLTDPQPSIELASVAAKVKPAIETAASTVASAAAAMNPLVTKIVASAPAMAKDDTAAVRKLAQKPTQKSGVADKKLVAKVTTAAE